MTSWTGSARAGDRSPGLSGTLVAFASFVGVFATTPGQTVGVSSFIDPIAIDLGLAREHVLLLYSIGTFLGILTAPSIGKLVDRFGPRRLIVPVVLALAMACGVMSRAQGAWSLAIGFVLLRAAAIAGLSLVSAQMVNLWFVDFRGRVTALSMMGLAVGGLVVPPLAEAVTQGAGWRSAYLSREGLRSPAQRTDTRQGRAHHRLLVSHCPHAAGQRRQHGAAARSCEGHGTGRT